MAVQAEPKITRRNSRVLEHEEFCMPQPGNEGVIRTESFVSDRMDPMTGLPVGKVQVLRCIECGAQVNTDLGAVA